MKWRKDISLGSCGISTNSIIKLSFVSFQKVNASKSRSVSQNLSLLSIVQKEASLLLSLSPSLSCLHIYLCLSQNLLDSRFSFFLFSNPTLLLFDSRSDTLLYELLFFCSPLPFHTFFYYFTLSFPKSFHSTLSAQTQTETPKTHNVMKNTSI